MLLRQLVHALLLLLVLHLPLLTHLLGCREAIVVAHHLLLLLQQLLPLLLQLLVGLLLLLLLMVHLFFVHLMLRVLLSLLLLLLIKLSPPEALCLHLLLLLQVHLFQLLVVHQLLVLIEVVPRILLSLLLLLQILIPWIRLTRRLGWHGRHLEGGTLGSRRRWLGLRLHLWQLLLVMREMVWRRRLEAQGGNIQLHTRRLRVLL